MTKPVIIGIAGNQLTNDTTLINNLGIAYTPLNFVKGVCQAGGLPVMLPIQDSKHAKDYINAIDGLILAGGQDISPSYYGEEPILELGTTLPIRDTFEFSLLEEALKQNKPVFAICRGLQLVNVFLGGSLYQDIHKQTNSTIQHLQKTDPHYVAHSLSIEKDSLLHRIWQTETTYVNTFHHQAVKTLGSSLRATAFSPDGFIEAFEWENNSQYLLAVQWHPEILLQEHHEQSRALFEDFVKQCASN
ncbi:gamma-glutamyl-gamma-aminobutyrate hydrolase family protein [Granulicatella sp. zg-ZJ]|uniref:gamma-glutamyl-gamma-aminobutyrate hydrolase family protein n=1 Tax=Granulicatella sp. zg-ZJ TaxID=2678504 RepID=UPI0013D58C4E|nr:gamma-glutamyl-gamma-aminobutyrate hydrolase family protein [Granulicatella sp. zg-ZJ]NEW62554.1 gamma-glutamyl-gamma-aminobutyrate hydrolase family protein [Granulicatella sp. zg-ZJ]